MMDDGVTVLGILSIAAALVVIDRWRRRRRAAALAEFARTLGLAFHPGADEALANHVGRINQLARGSNRYLENILRGTYRAHPVLVAEHHYQTTSTSSKGGRRTHHHWHAVVVVRLPRNLPELTIAREGFLSKLAQFVGYEDIDFESHEFSSRFVVRAKDRRIAYGIIHPQVMELLLQHQDLFGGTLEIDGDLLALVVPGVLRPEKIQAQLELVLSLRELLPSYLLADAHA